MWARLRAGGVQVSARAVVVPKQVGPYQVVRPLASGGMADVFEVEDPTSGDHLALKLLVRQGTSERRFRREYEALTRLNHPSIVRVYHLGMHEGSAWLTMELLDGVPLQVWVKRSGRPGAAARNLEVIRIGHRLAEALRYLHDRGLVHRDLKSANVVVLTDGRVKLLDFGTAHVTDAVERITRSGEFVGTFAYAAPEQLRAKGVDGRADLYSLGVLLYRLATGRRPFDATAPRDLARQHLEQAPAPPSTITPEIPKNLEQLILKLLAKAPDDRPRDAGLVADFLRAMLPQEHRHDSVALTVRDERVVGREWEQQRVVKWLLDPHRVRTLLVQGAAGSARARFVDGVADDMAAQGWHVVRLALGGPADGRAVGRAVVEIASKSARLPADAQEALEAVKKVCGRARRRVGPRARKALVYGVARVLEELRPLQSPTLLAVDDLDRTDPAGAELLALIHRAVTAAHRTDITVLASCTASPSGWWREGMPDAEPTTLEPFDVVDTARAIGAMTNRRAPPIGLARRVHAATGGHPRYIEEVVRDLADRGDLGAHASSGRLTWSDLDRLDVRVAPAAAAEVQSALDAMPVAHRRVLEALAVFGGDDVPEAPLAAAVALPDGALDSILDKLVDDCWVAHEVGVVRWHSRLVARLVANTAHPCRRRMLERQLASALLGEDPSPEQVRLLLAAGRVDEALPLALEAARELARAGEPAVALEILESLLARLPVARAASNEHKAQAYILHARCLLAVRPKDGAVVSSLTMARALAPSEHLRGQVERIAAELHAIMGRYPRARQTLEVAWGHAREADDAAELSSSVAVALGTLCGWSGEPRSAEQWYKAAQQVTEGVEDDAILGRVERGLAEMGYRGGLFVEAEKLAASAVERHDRAGDVQGAWRAASVWADLLRQQGRFTEALRALEPRLPAARRAQVPSAYVQLLLATARCEADLYRLGRAQECVDELETSLRSAEYLHLQLEANLVRARLRLVSGQPLEARVLLQDMYDRSRAAGLLSYAERGRSLLAEAVWALGNRDEAGDIAEAAWLGLLGTGDSVALADACVSWSRAVGTRVDPAQIFQPVAGLAEQQDAVLVRIEHQLATARWCAARGDKDGAHRAYKDTASLMNRIASQLGETERAALRVHPWARQVRQGLR